MIQLSLLTVMLPLPGNGSSLCLDITTHMCVLTCIPNTHRPELSPQRNDDVWAHVKGAGKWEDGNRPFVRFSTCNPFRVHDIVHPVHPPLVG